MDNDLFNIVLHAGEFLKGKLKGQPEIGVVLGSGLGGLAGRVAVEAEFDAGSIPGFPRSTVAGHQGKLIFGTLAGKKVMLAAWRVHYYEGHPLSHVTLGIRLMAYLKCHTVILSNAVGGVRSDLVPGDLVTIQDHLNLMGTNPLIGPHDERLGTRFPDMTGAYSARLIALAHETADELSIQLKKGVLAATSGPSYETPAEISMMKMLGADLVGMSVVPEVIVARQCALEVLAISCVTNLAAGLAKGPLKHEEVLEVSARISVNFQQLVETIIQRL